MMKDLRNKAVQMASQEEIFRAMSYAALKARAARLSPGEIIKIGRFELVVAEDDEGEGSVVQIIETRQNMECLAVAKAKELGIALDSWGDHERREWMASFWIELARILSKWQNIEMRSGPGENLTFEKAVYK
jgi:hypothetical protein